MGFSVKRLPILRGEISNIFSERNRLSTGAVHFEIENIQALISTDNIMILFTFDAILSIKISIKDAFIMLQEVSGYSLSSLTVDSESLQRCSSRIKKLRRSTL